MNQTNFKGYPSPPCALTQPKQEELPLPGPSNRKAGGKAGSKNNDGAGSVPEFIQKLFRMLENKAFRHTFCWGTDGTTFIVKDTNEFSKTILPKHFKHCNFASFVRQLNKYDFHKVRNADDGNKPYGDQAWEFVHPRFMRDRKDLLEEIRRKTPGKTKKEEVPPPPTSNWNEESMVGSSESTTTGEHNLTRRQQQHSALEPGSSLHVEEMRKVTQSLQQQIKELQQSRLEMESYLQQLSNTDCLILQELMDLGKQIQLKDNLIQDILKRQAAHDKETTGKTEHVLDTQSLLDSFATVSRSNSDQLERITQQLKSQSHQRNLVHKTKDQLLNTSTQHIPSAQLSYPATTRGTLLVPSSATPDDNCNMTSSVPLIIPTQQPHLNVTASAAAAAASMNAGSLIGSPLKTGDGLTFVTLGRLSSNTTVRDNKPAFEITPSESSASQHESSHHHSLQTLSQQQQQQLQHHQQPNVGVADVPSTPSSSSISTATAASSPEELYSNHTTATSLKRKMNIAGWTVPPRVLLVDDDSVYRDLSGKLLQVIGCSIDLAKDGVEALRKMGLEKYDLILMDIVMPNLDGISATRNIRQYDALTPIISMTSNFTDNDIMQYIGSGMTDILPKPFSKKTLYSMLEKYCAHLKAIQRVHRVQNVEQTVPRPLGMLGLPPPPDQTQGKSTPSSSSSSPSVSSGTSVKPSTAQLLPPQTKMEDPDAKMQEPLGNSAVSPSTATTTTTTTTTLPTKTTESTSANTFSIARPPPYPFPLTLDPLSNNGLSLQQQHHSYSTSIPTNTNTAFFNAGNPE